MKLIDEKMLITLLNQSKNVLLFEPPYKRKYPPLGLMKIESFCKKNGKNVIFSRSPKGMNIDTICVTTLFTNQYAVCVRSLKMLSFLYPSAIIIVGGVLATMRPEKFKNISNRLYLFVKNSLWLDQFVPVYELDYSVHYDWVDYSYLFSTRGCPNKCAYCFVPKLEPIPMIIPNWEKHIVSYKKNVILYDNNLTSFGAEHINNLANVLLAGKHKVCLDNAVDCKFCDEDVSNALARLPLVFRGLRTSFDRIEEDGIFQTSMKRLLNVGIAKSNIVPYVLFNFTDTPKEADYRARECINLGIKPYPQQYKPASVLKNKYVSKYWTQKLLLAFRHFWLFWSLYAKQNFGDWIYKEGGKKFKLKSLDYDKWNN